MTQRKPPTDHTHRAQESFAARLPHDDGADFERARRGLIARREGPIANESAGFSAVVWDPARWSFVEGDAPGTVNPSLWRQAKLNGEHGLFEVIEGIYQVRGYDTSVVTFIRGERGWVVIDPLTTTETATAAKKLVDDHFGMLPTTAVIYSHSHVDHYGGILGVVGRDVVERGECPIVAPEGFLHAAVEENVVAGAAMGRRASWQYGMLLPWDDQGHVDQGLAKGVPFGSSALIPPTHSITFTGERLTLDGVLCEFQLTPGAEAPAEMHIYLPDHQALCLAENCTATMHNVFTLRGTVVRDALSWSRYLDEALERYGPHLELTFATHGWPYWGRDDALAHVRNHRDLYRWTHDEAMRLANLGYGPDEIAAAVELPPGLWADYTCHGYYGTLSHNTRAVYQRHFGFFDGHPATLHPYPPVERAERYVRALGGSDAVLFEARRAFAEGDYRWTVEVLRHVVFADPANSEARALQADACEQLGYQAEAGPWRDVYLSAAQELRAGTPQAAAVVVRPSAAVAAGMTPTQVFDYLAVRLDGTRLLGLGRVHIVWEFTDTGDVVSLEVSNGVLHSRLGRSALGDAPQLTVRCERFVLNRLISSDTDLGAEIESGALTLVGDTALLQTLWSSLVPFPLFFPIIEP